MRDLRLNTVCEEAHCPNIGECWHHGTATFMILGDVCTRELPLLRGRARPAGRPRHGRAGPGGRRRPSRCELRYVVITSVDRDDLAGRRRVDLRRDDPPRSATRRPSCRIEVLIPDFQGDEAALRAVLDAGPDVLNHNTETVPRLYRTARPGGRYPRTLELLDRARALRARTSRPSRASWSASARSGTRWSRRSPTCGRSAAASSRSGST